MQLTPFQWALGLSAAFLAGVAKTGLPGLGILNVPLMVLAVGDARLAAGSLLPLLCFADIFAVVYWRRHAAARLLFSLTPWVLGGMACGGAALFVREATLRIVVGVIVALMLAIHLVRLRRPDLLSTGGHSAAYGLSAGFSTTVANAAGPVMNLYLLSKRLPKEEFLATGAWFFFLINLTKVPVYLFHGMINSKSLAWDAALAPAVLCGAVAGRWVAGRLSNRVFEMLVIVLTAASTVLLFL